MRTPNHGLRRCCYFWNAKGATDATKIVRGLNSPVFKILIREGGHTLFYKVFKFNFVYFISFEKWGGGTSKIMLALGLCQFTASPPSNAACLDVERLNKISQIKFSYDLSKNMFWFNTCVMVCYTVRSFLRLDKSFPFEWYNYFYFCKVCV